MKTVAIIHKDQHAIGAYPPDYAPYYASLYAEGAKRGLRFYEASSYGWDDRGGVFSAIRTEKGKTLGPLRPDVVWHKCSGFNAFTFQLARAYGPAFVNGLDTLAIARDKYATYRRFPELMARTTLLSELLANPALAASWRGDRIVAKPRTGLGGKGVRAVAKADLASALADLATESDGWIAQEWMDSSGGAPGLVEGVHDIRAVVVGGEITHFSVRSPKKGDFRCNVSAGGSLFDFEPGAKPVPQPVLDVVGKVVASLGRQGAYSVDCALDVSGRAYLGEVNNAPGLKASVPGDISAQTRLLSRFHGALCDLFVSVIAR